MELNCRVCKRRFYRGEERIIIKRQVRGAVKEVLAYECISCWNIKNEIKS